MKITPQMLGAVAVVAIAGAVSGATIGDSQVLMRGHTDTLPEAQIVTAANAEMRTMRNPPNHYPLETKDGTIEVAELALHGRLRDRGGDMWWEGREDDRAMMGAGYDFYATASPERIEHERRLLAFHAGNEAQPLAPRQPTRAEAPMALAEPAEIVREPEVIKASEERIGNAKTVDIGEALARAD